MAEFIGAYFTEVRKVSPRPRSEILLLARSAESPVVKALAAHGSDLVTSGFSVRLIVAQTDIETMPRGWTLCDTVEADCEVRWARNPRLMEAHEQLVLGPETCWIGDSMRREPTKCDAYEAYVDSCLKTTATVVTSFERLWRTCEPLLSRLPMPPITSDSATIVRRH